MAVAANMLPLPASADGLPRQDWVPSGHTGAPETT